MHILHFICSLLSCSARIAICKPIFSNWTCLKKYLELPDILLTFVKKFLGENPHTPLSQVDIYAAVQIKRVHYTLNPPPPPSPPISTPVVNNLSYALMLLRFCFNLCFGFSLFWKKLCPLPFRRRATSLSLYTFLL